MEKELETLRKVKGLLRDVTARTTEGLRAAVGQALAAVCPEDICGWFGSRGGVTAPVA